MPSHLAPVLIGSAAVAVGGMVALWLISIRLGDVSFIDACWGAGFVVIAAVGHLIAGPGGWRSRALVAVTAVWGIRLASYLMWRWRRTGPDPRYVALQRHAGDHLHAFTLRKVFLLQGALMWVVSLPVQLGQAEAASHPFSLLAAIGVVLAATGIWFEATADAQLVRFKANPANAGQVLDRGLWRYTRHPNYFGDCCVWWGLFLLALTTPVTFLAALGPVTMTFLLLKWSGVTILERRLHRHRPGYAEYVRRTSVFIPMPPKRH